MKDFIVIVLFVAILLGLVFYFDNQEDIKQHGIKPYFEKIWEGQSLCTDTNCVADHSQE